MSDMLQEMAAALERQRMVCAELQHLLQDEQEAISNLDSTRMEQINAGKEEVMVRQKRAADELRGLLDRLARQYGLPAGSTLGAVLAAAPKEAGRLLYPLQEQLNEVGTSLRSLAEQNRTMLERFLGTVNDSLGFLTRILNSSSMYGANGAYRTERSGAMIVNREA